MALVFLIHWGASAQFAPKEQNYAHQYSPNSLFKLDYKIATDGATGFTLYLRLRLRQEDVPEEKYRLSYNLLDSYEAQAISTWIELDPSRSKFAGGGNESFFRERFVASSSSQLLAIMATETETGRRFYHLIPLRADNRALYTDFLLYAVDSEVPLFDGFAEGESELVVKKEYGIREEIFMTYYEETFQAAEPPLITTSSRQAPELKIKEEATISFGQKIKLSPIGYYFFQSDSTSDRGQTVVVTDRFFPRPVLAQDVIEPFIYLSTRDEFNTINNAEQVKAALDQQLMKMSSNQAAGVELMRLYFRNVKGANEQFTTYKYGWKTDMGMIYSVYGTPDEVRLDKNKEEWIYYNRAGLPRLAYIFMRLPNIFTPEHFVLVRDRNYADYWFRTIDSWRKGRRGL